TVYQLIASNLNGKIKNIMLNKDLTYPAEKIAEQAAVKGSVTIICSPNNPTGSFMPLKDLELILEKSQGLVIVDEAYIHFGGETALHLIDKYPQLIILRTFSKAFGLAGLRIGMLISSEEVIDHLSKVKLPYNLDIFSILTLEHVFKNLSMIEKNIVEILKQRDWMAKELAALDYLQVYPTATNFFLIKIKESDGGAKGLFQYLVDQDVLIRDVSSYPMLANHLRFSIGTGEQNRKLIESIKEYFKNLR
ncbi:MAG: histidinol-phosphate aminotransferase family protein, partial [Spirochaetes bacterium]|nr:histidinol-phosphate aminotransferase family protein [Spirochaetota bacterium]